MLKINSAVSVLPVDVKAIVFHILTGDIHWDLFEITKLVMEIKM